MVDAATKERARELRRAGASLREIGKVVGVSHVTVREWTLGEPVGGPASGNEDVADGVVGLRAGTTPDPRQMLDGLISTWSGRAMTDRFAAALVERLLRQREALDAQDETRRDGCATHLEAVEVLAWFANLELFVRLEVSRNLRTSIGFGRPERLSAVDHLLNECEARIAGLFNHTGEYLPGHANYERAAQASVRSLEKSIELERAATETSIEEGD